jgi:DNA-binding transcriptional LysR family regulator
MATTVEARNILCDSNGQPGIAEAAGGSAGPAGPPPTAVSGVSSIPHCSDRRSDFVALVPERLVRDRADKLKVMDCPFPVEGFAVGMVWHERSHGHSGQRWVRETIASLINA